MYNSSLTSFYKEGIIREVLEILGPNSSKSLEVRKCIASCILTNWNDAPTPIIDTAKKICEEIAPQVFDNTTPLSPNSSHFSPHEEPNKKRRLSSDEPHPSEVPVPHKTPVTAYKEGQLPRITCWSLEENELLLQLAEKYHKKWDLVAADMNARKRRIDRSAGACSIQYQKLKSFTTNRLKWTPKDNDIILKEIKEYQKNFPNRHNFTTEFYKELLKKLPQRVSMHALKNQIKFLNPNSLSLGE